MSFFTLFNSSRKPEVSLSIEKPDEILQRSLRFEGGTVYARGGLQVDANLTDVCLIADDDGPIHITALGRLERCMVRAKDVVIAGDFSGEIEADGDVEVTNTAKVSGHIKTTGSVLVSPMADDAELRIGRLLAKADRVDESSGGVTDVSQD